MKAWKRIDATGILRDFARFNGATPVKAWKQQELKTVYNWMIELQWGHACEGVETAPIVTLDDD